MLPPPSRFREAQNQPTQINCALGPLFPEPRKPSGFEEGPGSKRPAIRVQFRSCIFEWFTRNLWQRQACMVVAGTQQECRTRSRKMPPLRVSHRKSCAPGASRIPQLVESSPECKCQRTDSQHVEKHRPSRRPQRSPMGACVWKQFT